MGFAKTNLDETSGRPARAGHRRRCPTASTASSRAPRASGTNAPAFDGTASGRLRGLPATDVGIISVDDEGLRRASRSAGWRDVDPEEYCAPDPAAAARPRGRRLLAAQLRRGRSTRARASAAARTTTRSSRTYTGTVPGDGRQEHHPERPGDSYDATFTITADGELTKAVLTGAFYPRAAATSPTRSASTSTASSRRSRSRERPDAGDARDRCWSSGRGRRRVRGRRHLRRRAGPARHDGRRRPQRRPAAARRPDRVRLPARVRRDAAADRPDRRPARPGARCSSPRWWCSRSARWSPRWPTTCPAWWSAGSSRASAAAGWCRRRWRWSPSSTPPSAAASRSAWSRGPGDRQRARARCSARPCSPSPTWRGDLRDQLAVGLVLAAAHRASLAPRRRRPARRARAADRATRRDRALLAARW